MLRLIPWTKTANLFRCRLFSDALLRKSISMRLLRVLQGPPSSPPRSQTTDITLTTRRRSPISNLNLVGNLLPETGERNPMVILNISSPPSRPGLDSHINDNYCINPTKDTLNPVLDDYQQKSQVHVSCLDVVNPVHFIDLKGLPQKKGARPETCKTKIKHVKGVSFVVHCCFAFNVHSSAKKCGRLTAKILASLAVPGFYKRLLLVLKPNKGTLILDLSTINLYLHTATFKMETPETIILTLQQGKWVTSLDFIDAYFLIPVSPRSMKYPRFYLNVQTYQFTAFLLA